MWHPIKPRRSRRIDGLWWGLGCLLAVPALLTIVASSAFLRPSRSPHSSRPEHISASRLHDHPAADRIGQAVMGLAHNANSGAEVDVAGSTGHSRQERCRLSGGGTYIYHRWESPGVLCAWRAWSGTPASTSGRTNARDGVPPSMTRDVCTVQTEKADMTTALNSTGGSDIKDRKTGCLLAFSRLSWVRSSRSCAVMMSAWLPRPP